MAYSSNVYVCKETKPHENRVALTPRGVLRLADAGHHVYVEAGAGRDIALDNKYLRLNFQRDDVWGGERRVQIVRNIEDAIAQASRIDLVVGVKEPQPDQYNILDAIRNGGKLFTYLHLAGADNPALLDKLLETRITAIAYETVTPGNGSFPLLAPMSRIAGELAIQWASQYSLKPQGGRGKLIGDLAGVEPSKVVIIGGGVAGSQAAYSALKRGAEVVVVDLKESIAGDADAYVEHMLKVVFPNALPNERGRKISSDEIDRLSTICNAKEEGQFKLEGLFRDADIFVTAIYVHGATAPVVITKDHFDMMREGTMVVDISIDQRWRYLCD